MADSQTFYWIKRETGFTGGFVFTLGREGEPGTLVKRCRSARALREYFKSCGFSPEQIASFRNLAGIQL